MKLLKNQSTHYLLTQNVLGSDFLRHFFLKADYIYKMCFRAQAKIENIWLKMRVKSRAQKYKKVLDPNDVWI